MTYCNLCSRRIQKSCFTTVYDSKRCQQCNNPIKRFGEDLDEMLGNYFQYEKEGYLEKDFEKAFKEFKHDLTLQEVIFLYFTYWTAPGVNNHKEFLELKIRLIRQGYTV